MRRLIAGVWVGEFGWEIMSWQGLLRKMAPDFDEIIVSSHEGNEPLYSDFATTFIPHKLRGIRDCWHSSNLDVVELRAVQEKLNSYTGTHIRPTGYVKLINQQFKKFGDPQYTEKFDIVVHARKPVGKRPEAAWPQESWDQLMFLLNNSGYKTAAIGTEAYLPQGAVDCRSFGLQAAMDVLSASKMALGPSSGPMHLASLCSAPHLVWTDLRVYTAVGGTSRDRYERIWNPLQTPCKIIDEYEWRPSPQTIFKAVQETFTEWALL